MKLKTIVALLVTVAAVVAAIVALPAGGATEKKKVLKVGWAQDVQTLNPFVAQDEENFRVWALDWDLLVNFSPDDLHPVPRPHARREPAAVCPPCLPPLRHRPIGLSRNRT